MRSKSLKIQSDNQTVDTCGTGGDMIGTLNISTSAAIVAASAGVKIAKHGNRSISSKSGSADMLEKLGYKISNDLKDLKFNLDNNKFCFLFAQYHHEAMKHVIRVRKELGTRTIFNLLGPLTNPANTKRQLLGVYDKKWVKIHCEVLKELGSTRAMVVHGKDGLDEISLSGITFIAELKDNKIKEYIFDPKEYGYEYIKNSDIIGGSPEYNAKKFLEMLDGQNKKFQHIIELNAGTAIYLSGITNNVKEGFNLARHVIENKITKKYLKKIIS
jgi:anthranilate phosphoribosyltransferase